MQTRIMNPNEYPVILTSGSQSIGLEPGQTTQMDVDAAGEAVEETLLHDLEYA